MIDIKPITDESNILDEVKKNEPQSKALTQDNAKFAQGSAEASSSTKSDQQLSTSALVSINDQSSRPEIQQYSTSAKLAKHDSVAVNNNNRLSPASYVLSTIYFCASILLFSYWTTIWIYSSAYGQVGSYFFQGTARDTLLISLFFGVIGFCIIFGNNALRRVAVVMLMIGSVYSILPLFNALGSINMGGLGGSVSFGYQFVTFMQHLEPILVMVVSALVLSRRRVADYYN